MKIKFIDKVGVAQMTNILLGFVTPCVLIQSYQAKVYTGELTMGLLRGVIFSAVFIRGTTVTESIVLHLFIPTADLMLDSTFESFDALKAYAIHPDHVYAADNFVRPFTASRSCLDFEI